MKTIHAIHLLVAMFAMVLGGQEKTDPNPDPKKEELLAQGLTEWIKIIVDLGPVVEHFEDVLAIQHPDGQPPMSLRTRIIEVRFERLRVLAAKDQALKKPLAALEDEWRKKVAPFEQRFIAIEKLAGLSAAKGESLGTRLINLRASLDLEGAAEAIKNRPKK